MYLKFQNCSVNYLLVSTGKLAILKKYLFLQASVKSLEHTEGYFTELSVIY